MDLLREEIAKKRKQLEQTSLINEKKKFFKREELNRKNEEEYWQRQAEKMINKSKQQQSNDTTANDSNLSSEEIEKMKLKKWIKDQSSLNNDKNNSNDSTNNSRAEERILPRKEVIKRLRERDEPITLFGENEIDAFKRLRKLEINEPDSSDRGFRNDFQEAMEKVDQAYLEEIVKFNHNDRTSSSLTADDNEMRKRKSENDVKIEETNTTIEEILEQAKYLGKQRLRGKRAKSADNDNVVVETNINSMNEQRKCDCSVILIFLKYLLELWGKQLNDRDESEKRSTKGRLMNATYTQTKDYLKPLFKQLTKQTIADDILKHLIIIVKYLLERNYIQANDAYLQMAIGNAPWPIGVTMVGIHARTGREKIFAQNIAHVLNDETQRKYIQALKRLMTQCQHLFPTDPSRCVEYTKQ